MSSGLQKYLKPLVQLMALLLYDQVARKHSVSPKFIWFHKTRTKETDNAIVRDPCLISFLILSGFKQIDYLLFARNLMASGGIEIGYFP